MKIKENIMLFVKKEKKQIYKILNKCLWSLSRMSIIYLASKQDPPQQRKMKW